MATSDPPIGRLRSRIRQQEVVAKLGQQALESADLGQLLDDAVSAVIETLEADRGHVLEYRPEADVVAFRNGSNWSAGAGGSVISLENAGESTRTVIRTREPTSGTNLEAAPIPDDRSTGTKSDDLGATSEIVAPIGSADDIWGVLGVYTDDSREFTDHDVSFVASVADVIDGAIENYRTRRNGKAERSAGRMRPETDLETTVDRITDAVFGLDDDWRVTYVNERAQRLFDIDAATLVGTSFWEAFPSITGTEFDREFRHAVDRQEPTAFEAYFEPHSTWLEVRAYPSESGLSVYVRDVTERKRVEAELRENNHTLARLYAITADPELRFDEKVDELLDLGRERLGLEIGFVADIDREGNRFEIVHSKGPDERLRPGSVTPLSDTYCRRTIESDELLVLTDGPVADEIDDHAYETWDFDSYVGGQIRVDGDLFGTLCFADENPSERSFTPAERSFVELSTQWLSYELERQRRQRKLERVTAYTDAILDAVDDIFYVVDAEGTFRRWNETMEDVTGYAGAEIESMSPADFFAGDDRKRIGDAIAEVFETGQAHVEADVRTRDGDTIPYEFAASLLEDPSGTPVLAGIGRDITERRRQQRRLEELISDLESSNERLEQFAYAASHDLQEPLRMVASYLTLVERRYADELDDDAEEFIAYAVDGATRMQQMIDGLLAYSRVDTQGTPLRTVDLECVLDDVREDLQVHIEETDAEVDVGPLPAVYGDPGQLRQLFQNLLDNALTYAGTDAPRISVSAENEGDEWRIAVRDRGIGIDPAESERIFQVFDRLHSIDEYDGTGIGLALCQRIIERHDGEIDVESAPGEGSTFTVTLPAPPTTNTDIATARTTDASDPSNE
ncbi:PAS domain-containing protein [Natronolimnohabitans innermongolicus]|uniref:histidine kinase n=1 Tax=Natronolimnohabitans innermongolicus JCM 12255 TaxID=1227499 RepID=L9XE69_9EURY|nr:PAS domain-containing protein [Natronolimnohabitans innermongolicus]ELY58933.1 multi-sensor signal transduction histidine kinase [Natronolimnohabitans innermongolicus JCM 12255]